MKNITSLNQIARILTPMAMVIFLTMELVNSQQGIGLWVYPVAFGALCTSVGIEAWGMMSGSNVEKAWAANRSKWSSGIQLFLYVVVTMWLLHNNAMLITLPIVASLVYVSAALYESLNKGEESQAKEARQSLMIRLRKEEEQARREHELALEKMRLDAEVKKEKLRASTVLALPANEPAKSQHNLHECETCGKQFGSVQGVNAHQRFCAGAPQSEIADRLGVSRQAVSKQVKQMNGAIKEVTQ